MTDIPAIDPLRTRRLLDLKHGASLLGCRFDPAGRYLFAAGQDDAISRFDLASGERTTLTGHNSWARAMAFVAGESRPTTVATAAQQALTAGFGIGVAATEDVAPFFLISGDYHGRLTWWEGHIAQPKPVRVVDAHDGWVRAVAVSPTGCVVASCGNDNLVKLWSTADGRHLHTFEGHDSHVYNLAFHPNRVSLVSGDLHGTIKQWDCVTGRHVRDLDAKILHKFDAGFVAHIGGLRGLVIDAAGKTLACSGITNVSNAFAGVGNPGVLTFDWATGAAKPLNPKVGYQGTAWGVHVLPGFVLAAGGHADGRVWFWRRADGDNVHTMPLPSSTRDLALHPDGTAFAVACHNGDATVYTMRK